MAKEKENPNHHMGKRTGYELIDGVYHIAPLYIQRMDEAQMRKVGVDDMLASVTKHASKDLEEIAKTYKRIWDDMADDLGLDFRDGDWQYSSNGTVRKKGD